MDGLLLAEMVSNRVVDYLDMLAPDEQPPEQGDGGDLKQDDDDQFAGEYRVIHGSAVE